MGDQVPYSTAFNLCKNGQKLFYLPHVAAHLATNMPPVGIWTS